MTLFSTISGTFDIGVALLIGPYSSDHCGLGSVGDHVSDVGILHFMSYTVAI